jgi:outer membrane protein assembly factor BamB
MSIRSQFLVFSTLIAFSVGLWPWVELAAQTKGKLGAGNELAMAEAKRGEWSRWRGPNGDGVSYEKGLLKEWPEEGPPLLWKASGLGGGFSSVAVAGGHIYTLGEKDGCTMHCRKLEDGSEVWATKIGSGGANCTPTVDGDRVYGVSKDGDLACLNTADGKLVWSKKFSDDFDSKTVPGWGFSESPLVDGDRLICTPGGDSALLAALDKKTGKEIWRTDASGKLGDRGHPGAGYSSVVISNAGKVKHYVTLVGRGVVGVDAATGKLLWHYGNVANGTANIPTPIIAGDFVFCSSGYGDGGSALLKISKKGSQLQADEVYFHKANEMQNHHGGMIRIGEYVYMGHGHNNGFPMCVHIPSGKIAWKPGRGPGSDSAAIAYADGNLYFRYQDGTMALIEANPKEYKLKGQFKIATHNGESWPHPVIAGGKLYLRDQDELLCYNISKD